jgi:putative peptide zinc metalloprotease protein
VKLIVNPGLVMHPFHGDSLVPLTVCEVPDSSGRPRRYLVPQHLCELLEICNGKIECSQAVAAIADKSNGRFTIQQVEQLIGDFLIRREVLLDPEAPSRPAIAARRLDRYLFFKLRFLKQGAILPIALRLQWLFEPALWKCSIALVLASHLWFYFALTHFHAPQIDSLPNSGLPWLLLLLSLSGMLHEFGHATALARFGGRSAEIGIGIYICFLALFVDLSEAWRLTNRQRVTVDLAGIYFQGITLIFLAIAFAATGGPVWACAFLLTDIQIAANLNPLLRLDGYWALADGLGIPNLRRRSIQYILFPMIRRRLESPNLQVTRKTLRIMRIYLVLALVFSAYLIRTLSLQCGSIIHNYPNVLRAVLHSWQANSWFDALPLTFAAVWRGMILISMAVLLIRTVSWVLDRLCVARTKSIE